MSLVSLAMRLHTNCPGCQISNPINGIVSELRCYHCSDVFPLAPAFWTWVVHEDVFARAARQPGEELRSGRIAPVTWLHYMRRAPRCPTCKGPEIDVAGLRDLTDEGRCFCPGCGGAMRVRAADDLCRAIRRGAALVVGETAGAGGDAARPPRERPIMFACMNCGAGLAVDGSTRTVACDHCQTSSYLPDSLWRQLHPVPKPHDFYFLYQE